MRKIGRVTIFASVCLLLVSGCTASPVAPAAPSPSKPVGTPQPPPPGAPPTLAEAGATSPSVPADLLFDDFSYASREEMRANGWIIRAQSGWPGVPGEVFNPENVSFAEEEMPPGNRILRMSSSTDGTSQGTAQTQICHKRQYLEGTYAARVYLRDAPVIGPDGDQVVEAFYAITPYRQPLDPSYSEMDFEYLPNGGWGWDPMTLMSTTWETVRIEPWLADNAYDSIHEDQEGWRTLVVQAMDRRVRYYVSGKLVAEHGGNYYPDSPMSINFNLWFINGGLLDSREQRSYQVDIDWVFHQKGMLLTPEQVNKQVRLLRESSVDFMDTVPELAPPLESPCDL